jgi:hypothetical protein
MTLNEFTNNLFFIHTYLGSYLDSRVILIASFSSLALPYYQRTPPWLICYWRQPWYLILLFVIEGLEPLYMLFIGLILPKFQGLFLKFCWFIVVSLSVGLVILSIRYRRYQVAWSKYYFAVDDWFDLLQHQNKLVDFLNKPVLLFSEDLL